MDRANAVEAARVAAVNKQAEVDAWRANGPETSWGLRAQKEAQFPGEPWQ